MLDILSVVGNILVFVVIAVALFVTGLTVVGLVLTASRGGDYGLRFVWETYFGAFGGVFGFLFLLGFAVVGSMMLVVALL